jgi:LPXTG-site transpeptidase (sortase) family protein
MSKGVGHFPSSSAWNGNVAICGHNRGAKYTIGSVKDLSAGDTIQYETSMGTRTYAVTYVGIIDWTDWSYLEATSDNRITIITCLANQPTKRVCVQAREVCS